jgi:microsomal epoxide hydrolase
MKSFHLLMALGLLGAGVAWGDPVKPADHFFTASDGVTLHYLEAGEGPTIIFIPGWTMGAGIWEKQMDFFSGQYRVVALDPRCQGQSQKTAQGLTVLRRAQDIQELTERIKGSKVLWVGWSMGGSEALAAASETTPPALAGLVLVDAPPGMAPTLTQILKRKALLERLQADRLKETNSFVRWMFKKPHPESLYGHIVKEALLTPTGSAVALLKDLYAVSNWKIDYAGVQIPVLCFASEGYYPEGLWLQKKIQGLELRLMKRDGHALFSDDPDSFNRQLQTFMDQIGFSKPASK